MDITLCILVGFLCFVIGLIAGAIIVYRIIVREDDKQYELLHQINKHWGDYCRSLIHEFYGEKLKELDEESKE